MCKDVPSLHLPTATSQQELCMTSSEPCRDQAPREDSMFLSPQNLNSATALVRVPCTSNTSNCKHPNPKVKQHIHLPRNTEGWEEANLHFNTILAPTVLAASTPQQKSTILCEGIYNYFATVHGTRPLKTPKQNQKRPLHNRSLKEVEKKKNEARRELRKARCSGSPAEVVHSLAKNFSWVRSHSHLKRVSAARLMTRNARSARMQCYKNFRGCAKEVLDGSTQQIVPKFSNTTACQFFTEVYHSGPRNFVRPEWMPAPSLQSFLSQ